MPPEEAADIIAAPVKGRSASIDPDFPMVAKSAGPQEDMDAYLSKHDADESAYGDTDEEEPAEAEEKSTTTADAEESDEPATAESETKDESKDTDDDVSSDDYEKALVAIRRDGLDPDALRWGRKRLVEHGLARAAAHAKEADSYRELKEKMNVLEESAKSTKESSGNATPADEPFNLNGALEPFKDELGEESAKALEGLFRSQHEQAMTREKALNERSDRAESLATMGLYESARNRVMERFPSLRSQETWQTVAQKAETLMNAGSYASIDDAITDASSLAKLEDATAKAQADGNERADAAKRKGTPTGKSRRSKPASAKTPDETESDILSEAESKYGWED